MSASVSLWDKCLVYLRDEIPPQQYNTWIRPLHTIESKQNGLLLLAPNRFVLDRVNKRFLTRITELLDKLSDAPPKIELQIGSKSTFEIEYKIMTSGCGDVEIIGKTTTATVVVYPYTNIHSSFTFDTFVEGQSNQLACAAAIQVSKSRPRLQSVIYLRWCRIRKTHLTHAVGNTILQKNLSIKVLYLHSERFVADTIKHAT